MPVKIFLNGADGRMGRVIREVAAENNVEIVHAIDQGETLDPARLASADVAVDFSVARATAPLAEATAAVGKALVIGTTGHSQADRQAITTLAQRIPIVWAGNYSVGVTVLNFLAGEAARFLPETFDIEVVESHHRHKTDSPSGTAVRLLDILRNARGLDESALRHGREGNTGERSRQEIGVHALRGGGIVGDHSIHFISDGERIELSHRAIDRRIFADGALTAAKWVVGRRPGLYAMEQVLGLSD